MSAAWQQPGMINPNRRDRDEFLRALDEARRSAMGEDDETSGIQHSAAGGPPPSAEFMRTLEGMAGRIKSYISAGILARLYADGTSRAMPEPEKPAPPPLPPKSEHEAVLDELHLTPNLTSQELARIRREFAKVNHPDRVEPLQRDEATRRMTIANSVIDEALRDKKAPH
jgi:hypothetical protein